MIKKAFIQHEQKIQRLLEIVPGLFIWILLFSPVWAGKTIPLVLADILVILAIYWLFRGTLSTIGIVIGYNEYRKAIKVNWLQKCLDLAEFDLPDPTTLPASQFLPNHLIVYPVGHAKYDVVKGTLTALSKQNYPLEQAYVAISLEERLILKDPQYFADMIKQTYADFPQFGDRLMFFEHPDHLPGEVVGAAANRAWGAKHAVAELEKRGLVISDFLITSPDEDITFHPEFLAAATYKYLTAEGRVRKFYQTAMYTFNNNYWEVPLLVRVLSISLTLPILASSVIEKHKRETFSCYTINLQVLKDVNYWDPSLGIDDTTFYWRPFFYFEGDWECEVFFVPLAVDAVYDSNYVKNHVIQYKQYVRWGWGVISFPIGVKGLLSAPGIPLLKRLEKLIHLFEVFIFFKVLAFLLTFSIPIVLLLNPDLGELVIWYSVPDTISKIMTIAIIFIFPSTIYKMLIVPPRPPRMSKAEFVLKSLIEVPFTLVTMLTYSFLPFVDASTRMMFGQKAAKAVSWTDKNRVEVKPTTTPAT